VTEHEILKFAAKAAGMRISSHIGLKSDYWTDDNTGKQWSPRTDDGDALRLAVMLRMDIQTPKTELDCAIAGTGDVRGAHVKAYSKDEITDPFEATRHAIVMAACEIGKSMG
jgi:hypothetical protein